MKKNNVSASVEAEQSLLGGLMLDPNAWLNVTDTVKPEHFYRRDHQLIFGAIVALSIDKKPLDPVTVSEFLDRRGQLKEAGGLAYLGSMTRDTPGAANVKSYAEIIHSRWRVRSAAAIGEALQVASSQGDDLVDDSIEKLMHLSHRETAHDGRLADALPAFLDDLDEMYRSGSRPPGVMTGLNRLDAKTGGFSRGHLIIVAGRPSMGKTTFALNICANNPKLPIGMMSGEQPKRELVRSMIAMRSGVSGHRMRIGKITEEDWPKITEGATAMRDMPLYVNDAAEPHIDDIGRQARKWKHYHGIELLISDYLQRQNGPGDKRHEQVENIVRGHKEIARELDIPVVLLCQINREVEKRDDKRPLLSDLRDSGAIEQEGDVILTLYRDEVYYGKNAAREGEAEIAAVKNRHGPCGVVSCRFDGPSLRFEDYEYGQRGDPGLGDDLPFDSPRGGNGTDQRQVANRRGSYRRSSAGGDRV